MISGSSNQVTHEEASTQSSCFLPCGCMAQVPGLLNLNLRSNPLVEELGYQSLILRALPLITQLDCNPITTGWLVSCMNSTSQ
jgi:hypothetical protein